VTCDHGYDSWRTTRTGESICPICRRLAKRVRKETAARRARFAQPHLDIPALVAHDDSLNNVISLTAARARRRRPKEI
jgi:uncharacterized Zn finger protein (UPF0148 family)